jgi:hypothetical protein
MRLLPGRIALHPVQLRPPARQRRARAVRRTEHITSPHPASLNAQYAVINDPATIHLTDTHALWKAIALSPTPEILHALLDGQNVPVDKLDPAAVQRFGLK